MGKSTPEGAVKDEFKMYLKSIRCINASQAVTATTEDQGWYFMPVSNGMGVHGLPDFLGHFRGVFFAVETKADEKKDPTPLQRHQLDAIRNTRGRRFVFRGLNSLGFAEFKDWVESITQKQPRS